MAADFLRIYLLVITCCLVQNTDAQDINGVILAKELSKVADAVGFSFMQVYCPWNSIYKIKSQ